MPKQPEEKPDPIVVELVAIKRLLVVLLLKAGTSQSELAEALNVSPATLSRMLPARKFKPFGTSKKE